MMAAFLVLRESPSRGRDDPHPAGRRLATTHQRQVAVRKKWIFSLSCRSARLELRLPPPPTAFAVPGHTGCVPQPGGQRSPVFLAPLSGREANVHLRSPLRSFRMECRS
jgi:hypothetical protein